jgi:hypothetical protein
MEDTFPKAFIDRIKKTQKELLQKRFQSTKWFKIKMENTLSMIVFHKMSLLSCLP